jgi:DNA polymerase gamma 1
LKELRHASGGDADATGSLTKEEALCCPRNSVGVQLLSGSLQRQLFPATSAKVPEVSESALSLSHHHLKAHGLEPEQASSLPPIAFDLPALQGKDLSEHFWTLGRQAAQPWLGMAHNLASGSLHEQMPEGSTDKPEKASADRRQSDEDGMFAPLDWLSLDPTVRTECNVRPPRWLKEPGWVRYPVLRSHDGSQALGPGEPVQYPLEADGALVFDVETMVQESQFPVMATAAGANAWYAWLSPWFLQKGERYHEKDHLIPFGPNTDDTSTRPARLLIGHNVGYDRARIRDEYTLKRTNIRFLDTMSLHVATRGIASPQRGAWQKYNKSKTLEKMLENDDVEDVKKAVIRSVLGGEEVDEDILASLDLDEVVAQAQGKPTVSAMSADIDTIGSGAESASLLWQDITSKNGLADVAKLHCNIDLPKDVRNFFVDGTSREELYAMTDELLTYCATDVLVTHKVFTKVWPSFVQNCPNPATAAGVLALSSAILPVDDEWLDYIKRCDENYESSLRQVGSNLVELAEELRKQGTDGVTWEQALAASTARAVSLESASDDLIEAQRLRDQELGRDKLWWETEAWASQLDWTPKKIKKSRAGQIALDNGKEVSDITTVPKWYRDKVLKSTAGIGPTMALSAAILRLRHQGRPFLKNEEGDWQAVDATGAAIETVKGSPLKQTYLKKGSGLEVKSGLGQKGEEVLASIRESMGSDTIRGNLRSAADELVAWASRHKEEVEKDAQLQMLDWSPVEEPTDDQLNLTAEGFPTEWWPKWYWDLYKSATGELEVTIRSKIAPLLLRLTWLRCPLHHSREHGWVFRYDPQSEHPLLTRQKPLPFTLEADLAFRNDVERTVAQRLADIASSNNDVMVDPASITPVYFKVPHAAGDGSNVGSPFSKSFVPFFEKGTLQSEHPEERGREAAKSALETNARCSYWIGVRDRVQKQLVVWDGQGDSKMHFLPGISGARQDVEAESRRRKGIILPQVVPMGTVTRRAIEKTWLTASNAKGNRVGSELKSMVKAPPGWSIVGADVDSQELWICSVMGDAQFGFHGATAVGWMTLEGSKSMGTDLHSKTASILGTSRNQAKVFNYSRIYGAGIRHSSQLLLKATPDMSTEEAMRKAKELYASTKGKNTYTNEFFGRRFWFGGTESYVFNKLEEIALGEQPKTPALDCGVTAALTRKYLPKQSMQQRRFGGGRSNGGGGVIGNEDYMPSRINWVVQSSGVDYLHLLITAVEYLINAYGIEARFMLSVHDEVRYLAKDGDVERFTLALQIANLWTRAMFAHKLQMDSLPQGVGFFAQVDVDKVLRKETDDACVTPSQPDPIPFGKAVDIYQTLSDTNGGSLFVDGRPMAEEQQRVAETMLAAPLPPGEQVDVSLPRYKPSKQQHRSLGERGLRFLQAQASEDVGEIAALEERAQRKEHRQKPARGNARQVEQTMIHDVDDFGETQWEQVDFGAELSGYPSTSGTSNAGKSRGLHTSSRVRSLPHHLQEIIDQFPPKPFKLHVPFYKTTEHRYRMLWQIYAALLRASTPTWPSIRTMVGQRMRRNRYVTSPRRCRELEKEATKILTLLRTSTEDNENGSKARTELKRIGEVHQRFVHAKKWKEKEDSMVKEMTERKRVPKLTGSLLAPTLYNPPLLRYKPVQPDHITMTIFNRRRARIRRQERMADSQERIRHLVFEARLGTAIKSESLNADDAAHWVQTIQQHERAAMNEATRKEHARAAMVFSASMLRVAKNARRGRHRHVLRVQRARSKREEDV